MGFNSGFKGLISKSAPIYIYQVSNIGLPKGRPQFNISNVLTNSTKQSTFWEINISSDSQEISGISYKPNVRYRIYNSPPPVPILNPIKSTAPIIFLDYLI